MKTYRHLFEDKVGFIYNGKHYNDKSYTMNYYHLVKDILDGIHGTKLPTGSELTKMFGATVYTEYDKMPESVTTRRLYKELGDIYVLTNKDIRGFNAAIDRISKTLGVSVKYLED
jgi:hypothetical protein